MSNLEVKILSKMLDPDECSTIWDMGLRSVAFEDITNRAAYDWMMDYWRSANMLSAPTWVVMENEFPTLKLDKEVDEATEWMVGALQQRLLINRTQDALLTAADSLDVDPEATVGTLWRTLYQLSESTVPRNMRVNMAENAAEREEDYNTRNQGEVTGVPFGLAELDAHTRGILPSELAAVAAYTKVGKSWLLCKAATEAQRMGHRPIVFTLEMRIPTLTDRIDAINSGVSYSRLDEGQLMPDEVARLRESRAELTARGPLYVERPPRGDRTVKAMVNRARQLGCDYLIIDQLSFVDAETLYTGDRVMTAKHTDLIFELKDEISRESAGTLPCLLAVQLNRETMRTGGSGGRGALWNFANASFIEQTVDMALGLWRNDDMRANNLMGLDIMGSRRTDKESWICEWRLSDRTRMRIREVYVGD